MPSKAQLDVRAFLLHRHHGVRLRTQVQNASQAIALAHGLRRGPGLQLSGYAPYQELPDKTGISFNPYKNKSRNATIATFIQEIRIDP